MTEADVPAGINPGPVTAWMAEHVGGVEPPLRFERVAGGHSCLTYVVEDRAARRYVLRRPPTRLASCRSTPAATRASTWWTSSSPSTTWTSTPSGSATCPSAATTSAGSCGGG